MKVVDGNEIIEAEIGDIEYTNSIYKNVKVRIGIDIRRCSACYGIMSFRDGYYCPLCDRNINLFLIG